MLQKKTMEKTISKRKFFVVNARTNNLKEVTIEIPLGALTLFSGPSGSGKSSLAVDTILLEGKRCLIEAIGGLNNDNHLPRAKVDKILGLPITIGMTQDNRRRLGPYKTLGTQCEIYPLIQNLLTEQGVVRCPETNEELAWSTSPQILQTLITQFQDEKVALLAKVKQREGIVKELLLQGYARVFSQNKVIDITELDPKYSGELYVVIDRFRVNENKKNRILESIQQCLLAGSGQMHVYQYTSQLLFPFQNEPWSPALKTFLSKPSVDIFSFTSSKSACLTCKGTGNEESCPDCHGSRLQKIPRIMTWQDNRLEALVTMPIDELKNLLRPDNSSVENHLVERLQVLVDLGLGYVPLTRSIDALSSGERSRVQISRLLMNKISHALFIIDEPSHGLDDHSLTKVIQQITKLLERQNSVIVIDHHEKFKDVTNNIFYFGPQSGKNGGQVSTEPFATAPQERLSYKPKKQQRKTYQFHGLHFAPLVNPSPKLLLHRLNVICGPSGSGKSTLAKKIIPQFIKPPYYWVQIDDRPFHGNQRSCVATATKLWNEIRTLFAQTKTAKQFGFSASHFSFNTSGGRCELCLGLGLQKKVIPPLPPVEITCSLCNGQRFDDRTLCVKYADKNINEVLSMEMQEAQVYFQYHPKIHTTIQAICAVGLEYLPLGQLSSTLSGGESRRLRLATQLSIAYDRKRQLDEAIIIIDDPTVAMHPLDMNRLYNVFIELLASKATLICTTNRADLIDLAANKLTLRR